MDNEKIKTRDNFQEEPKELLNQALGLALKIPMVKVNRISFLTETFSSMTAQQIDEGVPSDYFDIKVLDKAARKVVSKGTIETTFASVAMAVPAVIPGAGTVAKLALVVPDFSQNLGVCINIAQKIAFIYGVRNFEIDSDDQVDRLVLLSALATMFGGGVAAPVLRNLGVVYGTKFSTLISKTAVTKLAPRLYKWLWVPLAKAVAPKMAPKAAMGQAAKFIPFGIGVGAAGIITWFTTSKAGNRLIDELRKPIIDPEIYEKDKAQIESLLNEADFDENTDWRSNRKGTVSK
jgi:hypothetical protein